jgi:membrane-bound ClpP family serine protease
MIPANGHSSEKTENSIPLERLLDDLGWAALFITVGALWLTPAGTLPQGTWLIAVGFILLVLNVARYLLRIELNGFTLLAGTLALLAGVAMAFAIDLPIFPIALIVIGVCMLLSSIRRNMHESPAGARRTCCW